MPCASRSLQRSESGQLHGGPHTAGNMDAGRSQPAAVETAGSYSFHFKWNWSLLEVRLCLWPPCCGLGVKVIAAHCPALVRCEIGGELEFWNILVEAFPSKAVCISPALTE